MTNRWRNHFFTEQNIVCENRVNLLLYTIRCSMSIFVRTYSQLGIFFYERLLRFVEETATSTQILQRVYVILPLFRRCLRIVYSGLYDSLMSQMLRNVSRHCLLHVTFWPNVRSMSSIVIPITLSFGVFFGRTTSKLISSTDPFRYPFRHPFQICYCFSFK